MTMPPEQLFALLALWGLWIFGSSLAWCLLVARRIELLPTGLLVLAVGAVPGYLLGAALPADRMTHAGIAWIVILAAAAVFPWLAMRWPIPRAPAGCPLPGGPGLELTFFGPVIHAATAVVSGVALLVARHTLP